MTDVQLHIDEKSYQGWKSVRVHRSMEAMAGTFSLEVTDKWPDQAALRPITPGATCRLTHDGASLITGHIDDVGVRYDATSHEVTVAGRDKTADLVDCSAMNSPGQWRNRTLQQIVSDLIKPFGVALIVHTPTGASFSSFALERGETVYETIERLCRARGVLATSDSAGNLVITRASMKRLSEVLERGVNILSASADFSHRDRFSTYTVNGQQPGSDSLSAEQLSQTKASARDGAITRYRPLLLRAEQAVSTSTAKDRAIWESNMRAARARGASVTVQGWKTAAGELWEPNRLVAMKCDWLGINQDMLISAATYLLDDQGTHTELELVLPGAYELAENMGSDGWLA